MTTKRSQRHLRCIFPSLCRTLQVAFVVPNLYSTKESRNFFISWLPFFLSSFFYFILKYFLVLFEIRVSLCSFGWPGTPYKSDCPWTQRLSFLCLGLKVCTMCQHSQLTILKLALDRWWDLTWNWEEDAVFTFLTLARDSACTAFLKLNHRLITRSSWLRCKYRRHLGQLRFQFRLLVVCKWLKKNAEVSLQRKMLTAS